MTVESVYRSKLFALASLLLVANMVHSSDAFSVTPQHKSRNASPSTSAIGYTMQIPEFAVNLPKSTWYDVANPTDRRVVYDDGPSEFTFASIGSNWPEDNDIPEKEETQTKQTPEQTRQPWSRFNPIRGARNLIRRVL